MRDLIITHNSLLDHALQTSVVTITAGLLSGTKASKHLSSTNNKLFVGGISLATASQD